MTNETARVAVERDIQCGYCAAHFAGEVAYHLHAIVSHDAKIPPHLQREAVIVALDRIPPQLPVKSPYQQGVASFQAGENGPRKPPGDASWAERLFNRGWEDAQSLSTLAQPAGEVRAAVIAEVANLARRDIQRTQTDFLGRMAQSLCAYEGIFYEHPDGDFPDHVREEAEDEIASLAGLALAQLAMLRAPADPLAALADRTPPAGEDARDKALSADREVREIRASIINTPETADFMAGVPIEAAHQRERWGVDNDGGKSPFDWFWLIGYLTQKAADAAVRGDDEKAKHHTISTAAALANWHAALAGTDSRMRPGIDPAAVIRSRKGSLS